MHVAIQFMEAYARACRWPEDWRRALIDEFTPAFDDPDDEVHHENAAYWLAVTYAKHPAVKRLPEGHRSRAIHKLAALIADGHSIPEAVAGFDFEKVASRVEEFLRELEARGVDAG